MRTLVMIIAGLGDWLVSLSDRTKKVIVSSAFLLLIGGSIYKLAGSIKRLNDPQPMASPVRLVEPMSQLSQYTQDKIKADERIHKNEMSQLDSLLKTRLPQKLKIQ